MQNRGGRDALSTCKTRFATATVIALVALRLSIGWHFYQEGEKKWVDPDFTSAPFLLQATGPLAPYLQQLVPDFHDWVSLLAQPLPEPPPEGTGGDGDGAEAGEIPADRPYHDWAQRIVRDWQAALARFTEQYQLDQRQSKIAADALSARTAQMLAYLDDQTQPIADYRYELQRLQRLKASPLAGQVPFQDTRIRYKKAETDAMPYAWIDQLQTFENQFEGDLRSVLTKTQKSADGPLFPPTLIGWMDQVVTYWVLGVGVCLMLGLLTRTAAVAGALFLATVIATQPPWVQGAQPVHYQLVEMVALAALATTPVGRWGGLDFFLHAACGCRRGEKGNMT